ncbi:UNVERIFIED_CONTAM: ubiquitin-conjugating enzyme E2 W [Siphonaria sp. JEL0065]|nr:ubiquitin-conjugating enzyme E2 W [Siphonaria sp. JEL0065]
MSNIFLKRLTKELKDMTSNPPSGITVENADDALNVWKIRLDAADGTVYSGESFVLQFKFGNKYPLESPEVVFLGTPPVHPHIYSNGHICLSILYDQWSPALTVSAVCLSILSMLSSCGIKEPPPDDASYVTRAGTNPKMTTWAFHDDKV